MNGFLLIYNDADVYLIKKRVLEKKFSKILLPGGFQQIFINAAAFPPGNFNISKNGHKNIQSIKIVDPFEINDFNVMFL